MLLDLTDIYNTSVETIAYMFTCGCVGGIVGSFTGISQILSTKQDNPIYFGSAYSSWLLDGPFSQVEDPAHVWLHLGNRHR